MFCQLFIFLILLNGKRSYPPGFNSIAFTFQCTSIITTLHMTTELTVTEFLYKILLITPSKDRI